MTVQLGSLAVLFGQNPESPAQQLFSNIEIEVSNSLDGLLSSAQTRTKLLETLADIPQYRLSIWRPQFDTNTSGFYTVNFEAQSKPAFVGLFCSTQPEAHQDPLDTLPDNLEVLTVWALLANLIPVGELQADGTAPWRNFLRGKGLVALPATIPLAEQDTAIRLVSGLFQLAPDYGATYNTLSGEIQSCNGLAVSKSAMSIGSTALQLLNDAARASAPKWRTLSLYRVLENGYLNSVRDEFLRIFDKQPAKALKNAQESLASEPAQLVALAESKDLKTEFEVFSDIFDGLVDVNSANPNQFALAIDHELRTDKSPLFGAQERFKKGISRLYKIRCAIAHAGTASIVYEQFEDADIAADTLRDAIEKIVRKLMGIRVLQPVTPANPV